MFVNSVCGCAAGMARPALAKALPSDVTKATKDMAEIKSKSKVLGKAAEATSEAVLAARPRAAEASAA